MHIHVCVQTNNAYMYSIMQYLKARKLDEFMLNRHIRLQKYTHTQKYYYVQNVAGKKSMTET
jgi:hypothetical protein